MKLSNLLSDYADYDADGEFWLNIEDGFIYQWDDLPVEVRRALLEAGRGPHLAYRPSRREIVRWVIEGALGAVILFGGLWLALAVLT